MALPLAIAGLIPGLINKAVDIFDRKYQTEAEKESARRSFAAEAQAQLQEAWEREEAHRTERHKSDMASDSWLSKNIRPMVLIYLMSAWTVFAGVSVSGVDPSPVYLEMLKDMLMAAFGFYFVSRGAEKIVELVKRKG